MHENSLWNVVFLTILLLFFVASGLGHVLNPDWFLTRSGERKGGDLLAQWNRLGCQMFGAILVAFSGYGLYSLFSDYFFR